MYLQVTRDALLSLIVIITQQGDENRGFLLQTTRVAQWDRFPSKQRVQF